MKESRPSYQRLKQLFEQTAGLPEEQWDPHLRSQGADDVERAAVTSLLRQDRQISQPSPTTGEGARDVARSVKAMLQSLAPELTPGMRVGPWRIAAKIGQGGMGVVYRAERDDGQFQQSAAIKVLAGFATSVTLGYLASERQILASLDHPNIARLIDGGDTPDGGLYLAMDLVDGVPIDRHCRDQKLNFAQVIRLFRTVCQTVAYAHQRLILHCDLKPSNVLVARDGRPMLLDFGIAQMMDGAARAGWKAFTPRYASPEQTVVENLTTAADVYSLGRMLEELLAQCSVPSRKQAEVRAIITRATAQKQPERYPDAVTLDAELARLEADEPVAAMPASFGYRGRKFVERHWGGMLIGAAFIGMGSVLTLSALNQRDRAVAAEQQARVELERAVQAERVAASERDRAVQAEGRERLRAEEARTAAAEAGSERDRARRAETQARSEAERALKAEVRAVAEAETTQAVRDFLLGLFQRMNNSPVGARKLTAYELLEQGRKQVHEQLGNKPVLRSAVLQSLARIYDNIGDLEQAQALYRETAELERLPGSGRPLVLALMLSRQGLALSNDGKHAAAEPIVRESLALRLRHAGAESLDAADSHAILGLVLTGLRRAPEAREHLEKSLAIRIRIQGEKSEEVAVAAHNLGQHYALTGATDKGVREYQRAIDIKTNLFGADHPKTLNSIEGLGLTLWRANRLVEAEPLLARLYKAQLEINGPQAERVASAADAWANVLFDLGRFAEARERFTHAVNILGAVPPEQRQLRYAFYSHNLALLMEEQGDYAAAAEMFRDSLAVRERHWDDNHVGLARSRMSAARLYLKHGWFPQAELLMKKSLATRERQLKPGDAEIFDSRLGMVELALAMQGPAAAETALQAISVPADLPAPRKTAYERLKGRIELATGKPDLSLKQAAERIEALQKSWGAAHPRTLLAILDQAELLAGKGDIAAARPLLTSVAAPLRAALPVSSVHLARLSRLESLPLPGAASAN